MTCRHRFSLLAFAALACPAFGQWSSDPAVNLALADGAGDQTQPKVVPTSDGGAYISWFNGIGTGFDVRLQRVDVGGNEAWAHGGILVADRGFSSTQDYALALDSSGNALLAFRDDSGVGVQISVAKVSTAGALLYGPTQVTSTTDFVAAPTVAGTSDGGAVVAWTQDVNARLQKLDSAGAVAWGAGVTLTPGVGSFSPADMHSSGTDVVMGFVHQLGGFGSPRHLIAQKFDVNGALQWGAGHVAVFDGGSLQFGNFPDFISDGSGGGLFSWYDTAGVSLQSYAQHVDANGTEIFAHNGVALSTDAARIRVAPSISFNQSTGETFAFWTELNGAQSQSGVWGQKLDFNGVRQWTNSGAMVVPLGASSITNVKAFQTGGRALVIWDSAPSFGQDQLFGARLDRTGAIDIPAFDVSSTSASKSRLALASSASGFAVLAWVDDRGGTEDVYLQNVSSEGELGEDSVGTPYCFCSFAAPCGNTDANGGCVGASGQGARMTGSGTASVGADDLILTVDDIAPNKFGLIYMGGSMIRAPFGNGQRCVGTGGMGTHRFGIQNSGGAGQFTLGPGIVAESFIRFSAQGQIQIGQTWNLQAWFRDQTGPCGDSFNTSSAISITFTP